MYKKITIKVTIIGIIVNTFLFLIKLIAGLLSQSLALISDAINSLTDILTSVAIYFAVKISCKRADQGHPFGHHRVQPLAAFIVAIFTAILGFEIIKMAIKNILTPKIPIVTAVTILVPLITIIVKIIMAYYFINIGNRTNSPAIKASGIDSRNDVLTSVIVLIAIMGSMLNINYLDSIAAILVSIVIFYSGYQLGLENISYLIGKSPPEQYIKEIKSIIMKIRGVKGFNDIRAHYVGNFIHIEIHVEVNEKISTMRSHNIGKKVQKAVENLEYVDKAFIHIDPI